MGHISRKLTSLAQRYDRKVKERDWRGAYELAEQMVQMNPGLSVHYTYRGFVHYKLGELVKAESDFRQALTLKPDAPQIPKWWLSKIAQEGALKEAGTDINRRSCPHRHLADHADALL